MSAKDCYGRVPFAAARGPQGVRKTALRLDVEASGVAWELYRDRRRRGQTHAEAMAGVDKRRMRRAAR